MDHFSDSAFALAQVAWPDAELERMEIDYDDLKLLVRDGAGTRKRLTCEGHLGFEMTGFWDEVVFASAELTESGPFLDRYLSSIARRLGPSLSPTGSEARNRRQTMQLVLTLHDQCQLTVVMKGLRVDAVT